MLLHKLWGLAIIWTSHSWTCVPMLAKLLVSIACPPKWHWVCNLSKKYQNNHPCTDTRHMEKSCYHSVATSNIGWGILNPPPKSKGCQHSLLQARCQLSCLQLSCLQICNPCGLQRATLLAARLWKTKPGLPNTLSKFGLSWFDQTLTRFATALIWFYLCPKESSRTKWSVACSKSFQCQSLVCHLHEEIVGLALIWTSHCWWGWDGLHRLGARLVNPKTLWSLTHWEQSCCSKHPCRNETKHWIVRGARASSGSAGCKAAWK